MEYLHGIDMLSTFGGTPGNLPDSRPVLRVVVAHMGRSSTKEMAGFLVFTGTIKQMIGGCLSLL